MIKKTHTCSGLVSALLGLVLTSAVVAEDRANLRYANRKACTAPASDRVRVYDEDKPKGQIDVHIRFGHRQHRLERRHVFRHRRHRYLARGHCETRWVPPVYEVRYDACDRPYHVLTSEGYYMRIWVPPHNVRRRCECRYCRVRDGHFREYHRHKHHRKHAPTAQAGVYVHGQVRF